MRKVIQSTSIIAIFLLLMSMMLITGCDKGKLKANVAPTIQITSYEGAADSTNLPLQSFQAKIYWNATDVDGSIKGFAFRVLDKNGDPIPTPGYTTIDATGEFTPSEVKAISPNKYGWALHYKPGADQSIPLDSPNAKKSIWTLQKYATINFPAANANGDSLPKISQFEIICIDNRNTISNKVIRYFHATSRTPQVTLTTTKGNPNGGPVGSGLKLSFGIIDSDPFLTSIATHYEFAIYDSNLTTNEVTLRTPNWISTAGLAKNNEYLLTKLTNPALHADFEGEVQKTKTIIKARAYDLAGIKSELGILRFAVKDGYNPQTMFYMERVYAVGDNHYLDYNYVNAAIPEVWPLTFSGSIAHYATPFFKDKEGRYAAVYSPNLKVTLRWGWHGEYGKISGTGLITITDYPFDRKLDTLLDSSTDINYYSEVTGFDIRLDGQPYNFPPLASHIFTDPDGTTRWLRLNLTDPIAQSIVLTNLSPGLHTFEVRARDLQDITDPTPAVFSFYLADPLPKEQRKDVLVWDDDANQAYTPDVKTDSLYTSFISDALAQHGATGAQIDYQSLSVTNTDIRLRKVSYSDLQKYKLIIYHADAGAGTNTANLVKEYDALSLYLNSGGNMVISGCSNLTALSDLFVKKETDNNQVNLLTEYFGVGDVTSAILSIPGSSYTAKPWFIKGVSLVSQYPDVNLELTTPFYAIISNRHGLGAVSYINQIAPGAVSLYKYGSKTPGQDNYSPTQADYDLYTTKPVALKYTTQNSYNKCYLFTFPLSYMKTDDMKSMFSQIFTDVYGAK